jgi:long-chain acyl-CoA synthetase
MTLDNLFANIPQTVPHYCFETLKFFNKPNALNYKTNDVWMSFSGSEFFEKVKNLALGLADLGVKAGDRVAVISENRPEWSFSDLAILSLRAVSVPIYTTQAVEQIRYILEDSGAKALFISGKKIWKHAVAAIESVETLEKIIFFDEACG